MDYYLYLNDEQKGPYTLGQIQAMWRGGIITGNTLYWQEGFPDWVPLSSILHVIEPPVTPVQTPPSSVATQGPSTSNVTPPSYLIRNVVACIILLLFLLSFGFFHIVRTGSGITIVPKAHFTFSSTVISLDDIIDRYNNRSFHDAFSRDDIYDNLDRELERRGYITTRKRTWKEIEEETRRNMPDQ